jgi:hypothetical protein
MISPFGSTELSIVTSIVCVVELGSLLLCLASVYEHQRIERRHTRLVEALQGGHDKLRLHQPVAWIYAGITVFAVLVSLSLYLWSPHVLS